MNITQQLQTRRFLNEVRTNNRIGSHVNCFRYFPNNTDDHEDTKYQVFKKLRKLNHDVLVEAIFNNGSRCDILDLTEGIIYEIIKTEKREDVKKKNYPSCFGIEIIEASNFANLEVMR